MKLVVGLGNPGPEYDRTRHNAGFMAVDILRARHAPGEPWKGRFKGLCLDTRLPDPQSPSLPGERALLLKPTTYMNLSGQAVAEALAFYKLDPEADVLVLVDDIALPCGVIRLRASGGAGGHNGLSDIQRRLGTPAYARCRIGIDAPGRVPQADYVLQRFAPDQQPLVEAALTKAADAASVWANSGINTAMNQFNPAEPSGTDAGKAGGQDRPKRSASDERSAEPTSGTPGEKGDAWSPAAVRRASHGLDEH